MSDEFPLLAEHHTCSQCMCMMPWRARRVLNPHDSYNEEDYRKDLLEQGRWDEMIRNQNRLLSELRGARQEIKKLRRK